MVGGLGGAIAAPDAGAGTRGDFDPPRQRTRRFVGLRANWPRGVSPPPGGERGDVPPLDARAPPLAASAAPSGGGLRVSRAPDPPIPRVAASLTGLPPVALDRPRGVSPPPGGERGDVPPLDVCAPPSAASAADSSGGLRVSRAPDPPTPRVAASLTGLPPVALALVSRHADADRIGVFLLGGETEKMSTELVRTRCYSYICSGISPSKTVRLYALLRARRRETLFHSLVWPRNIGHNSSYSNENNQVFHSKL